MATQPLCEQVAHLQRHSGQNDPASIGGNAADYSNTHDNEGSNAGEPEPSISCWTAGIQNGSANGYIQTPRPGDSSNTHRDSANDAHSQSRNMQHMIDASTGTNVADLSSQSLQHHEQQQQMQLHSQHAHQQLALDNGLVDHRNEKLDLLPQLQQTMPVHLLQPQLQGAHQLGGSEPERMETDFGSLKLIPNPPDLQSWREKLFNVEDTIVLSEEEFQTYFPHVDNVYSHRSTQRYKRRPFVSHYWDCRLKGRPPGTPKSNDPNKKKRKRVARERDLCDVKIKITEYFPGALTGPILDNGMEAISPLQQQPNTSHFLSLSSDGRLRDESQPFGVLAPSTSLPTGHPGATGARYYTIQRVNGNGGNGRGEGVGGPHRHTLEDSDRVKKNSVQRRLLKDEKDKKKGVTQQKTYHKKATGLAFATIKRHSAENELKLYGSCFCPFVQRVWVALEVKGIPYQYIEVDPYQKPQSLLEVNPRGLVPALRHGNWGCYESTVLLEYLDDLSVGNPLLPPGDPQLRAHCRLWADHINRHIIPCFYRLLQEQDLDRQIAHSEELKDQISKLVNASHVHGPYFLGPGISFVDIQFAPWMLRLSRVLKPYRGWPDPEAGSRWASWVEAVETNEHVMATTSSDDLYLDSYQRYAENRPNTSLLANAINSGQGLP